MAGPAASVHPLAPPVAVLRDTPSCRVDEYLSVSGIGNLVVPLDRTSALRV